MSVRDELADVLAEKLNNQFKDYKVAYFLDGSDPTPTDIKEFVSTGSTVLDLAIPTVQTVELQLAELPKSMDWSQVVNLCSVLIF